MGFGFPILGEGSAGPTGPAGADGATGPQGPTTVSVRIPGSLTTSSVLPVCPATSQP